MVRQNLFPSNFNPQNFPLDDLISVLETRGTNCPDKSIPNAEERHHEVSPDILKGSCLIWMSASTNREERNDTGKRWRWRQRRGNQSGGMETLSKVNEQKDNVLAPNTTLSLSGNLARGIMEGVGCQDSEVYGCVCVCVFGSEQTPACVFLCWLRSNLRYLVKCRIQARLKWSNDPMAAGSFTYIQAQKQSYVSH